MATSPPSRPYRATTKASRPSTIRRPLNRIVASATLRVQCVTSSTTNACRRCPPLLRAGRRTRSGGDRAPGARRSGRGVPFDEMAVFLRTPQQYLGLLEHACARGDVPVYFDRGTRRPDPAGRAFVALLSCAADGLSAKRFDEYLSLGQVPRSGESTHAIEASRPIRCRRATSCSATLAADAAGRSTSDDESEPRRPPAAPSDRHRRRGDCLRHAARAVEMGRAHRRIVRGRRAARAPTARRAGGAGSTGWRPIIAIASRN